MLHWRCSRSSHSHGPWSQTRSRRAWARWLAWSLWLARPGSWLFGLLLWSLASRCSASLALCLLRRKPSAIVIVAVVCIQAAVEGCLLPGLKCIAASSLDIHLIELLLNRWRLVVSHWRGYIILGCLSAVVW